MRTDSQKRIGGIGLVLAMGLLIGCGGGSGGGSNAAASSSGPNNNSGAPVEGVATPSSVSVVTAQNSSAGG
jgi:hypothetical protein